jgi:Secretion system C-terminal sorting domain/Domain of unknown function (DUF4886)/Immunoglobulin domain
MKRNFAIVILFIMTHLGFSQNQINVLFIGNSLTGYNDLPGMVESISKKAGKDVLVDKCMRYGLALRHIVNDVSVIDKINEKDWDYVVLQSDDITAFDDMYHIEINTLNRFKEYIYDNCSQTNIIYQMIWGIKGGVIIQGEGTYTYEEYITKIYNGTLHIANELNLIIAPVGWAWRECINTRPEIELFASDRAHPAYPGSYLGACVFFNIIFGEEIRNNNYYGDLSSENAIYMQSVANKIVLENLELWNFSQAVFITQHPINVITCSGEDVIFEVDATNATSYQWLKDDNSIEGETSSNITIANVSFSDIGNYTCEVGGDFGSPIKTNPATIELMQNTEITQQPIDIQTIHGSEVMFLVEAKGNNLSYQWRFNEIEIDGEKENLFTIPSVSSENSGYYDVIVSGTCGIATSNKAELNITVSINEIADFGVNVYPNPSTGIINIANKTNKSFEFEIVNLKGQVVYKEMVNSVFENIDLSNFEKGIYIIEFLYVDKRVQSKIILY